MAWVEVPAASLDADVDELPRMCVPSGRHADEPSSAG